MGGVQAFPPEAPAPVLKNVAYGAGSAGFIRVCRFHIVYDATFLLNFISAEFLGNKVKHSKYVGAFLKGITYQEYTHTLLSRAYKVFHLVNKLITNVALAFLRFLTLELIQCDMIIHFLAAGTYLLNKVFIKQCYAFIVSKR